MSGMYRVFLSSVPGLPGYSIAIVLMQCRHLAGRTISGHSFSPALMHAPIWQAHHRRQREPMYDDDIGGAPASRVASRTVKSRGLVGHPRSPLGGPTFLHFPIDHTSAAHTWLRTDPRRNSGVRVRSTPCLPWLGTRLRMCLRARLGRVPGKAAWQPAPGPFCLACLGAPRCTDQLLDRRPWTGLTGKWWMVPPSSTHLRPSASTTVWPSC